MWVSNIVFKMLLIDSIFFIILCSDRGQLPSVFADAGDYSYALQPKRGFPGHVLLVPVKGKTILLLYFFSMAFYQCRYVEY